MALGGGVFTTQNKKLPGTYINFISASRASSTLSERGYAAMPLVLDWGQEGEVVTVEAADFIRDCKRYFGYDYIHDKMKGLRDLFLGAKTLYFYKLNTGVKAANTYCTAKYGGLRGNDLKTVITANIDNPGTFDVKTYLDTTLVDSQSGVASAADLVANDYVVYKADATLAATASTPLTGGTNGSAVTGSDWQNALAALEPYNFNALGIVTTTDSVKDLAVAYATRMRDEVGAKFQIVVYKKNTADYEGVISVENTITGEETESGNAVYWVTGAEAGCAVNKSLTNKKYDGNFDINVAYSQTELENALDTGKFIFHKVGNEVHVLEDINTFTSFRDDKNEDFSSNQTIRVLDQIANDTAVIFNTKFVGLIPNNAGGRISLWNEIVKLHNELQTIQAIENFSSEDITVAQGTLKKAVVVNDVVTPVNAMAQLYMSVVVSDTNLAA